MQFFYWNKSFEVGIPKIDSQHRKLVDLINLLATAIVESGRLPDVQALFGQLMEYAANHFGDEERFMAVCSLPEDEIIRHRKEHHGFVEKVQEIMQRPDLLQTEISEKVLEFLTTWLITHILGSDMKIAQALALEGTGPEPYDHQLFEISPVERMLLGALNETERRFRLISDHTPALIWVSDATGDRGFFNRSWCDFVGFEEEAPPAVDWADFIHPDDREAYLAIISSILAEPKPAEAEYRLRNRNGNYHWFLERILPRIDSSNALLGLIASSVDISSIKQAEELLTHSVKDLEKEVARRTEQLEQLMLTDPLTGIGNRRLLTKRLEEEVVRARRYRRPLTVVFLDIDHFKRINDTYGHTAGDEALVRVAESLKNALRECDLLGRFGGEEFVLLLPETRIDEALLVAERMRNDISQMCITPIEGVLTISAGLAELADNETGDALLGRSDKALYRAKAEGRNCCRIDTGAG